MTPIIMPLLWLLATAGAVRLLLIAPSPRLPIKLYRFILLLQRNMFLLLGALTIPVMFFIGGAVQMLFNGGSWMQIFYAGMGSMLDFGWGYLLVIGLVTFLTEKMLKATEASIRRIKRGEATDIHMVPADPALQAKVDALAAGMLPKAPQIYVLPAGSAAKTAFTTGFYEGQNIIGIHPALVARFTEDELAAVIAHELGHLKARDISYRTIAEMLKVVMWLLAFCLFCNLPGSWLLTGSITILVYQASATALNLLGHAAARRSELHADAVAVQSSGSGEPVASMLESLVLMHMEEQTLSLFRQQQAAPKPNPWWQDHPPVPIRARRARILGRKKR